MRKKKFNVGDVVHLNSGSPKLTVTHLDHNGVYVSWINWETNTEETACFVEACLEHDSEVQGRKRKHEVSRDVWGRPINWEPLDDREF